MDPEDPRRAQDGVELHDAGNAAIDADDEISNWMSLIPQNNTLGNTDLMTDDFQRVDASSIIVAHSRSVATEAESLLDSVEKVVSGGDNVLMALERRFDIIQEDIQQREMKVKSEEEALMVKIEEWMVKDEELNERERTLDAREVAIYQREQEFDAHDGGAAALPDILHVHESNRIVHLGQNLWAMKEKWEKVLLLGDIPFINYILDVALADRDPTILYTLNARTSSRRNKPLPQGFSYEELPDGILDFVHDLLMYYLVEKVKRDEAASQGANNPEDELPLYELNLNDEVSKRDLASRCPLAYAAYTTLTTPQTKSGVGRRGTSRLNSTISEKLNKINTKK